MKTIVITSTDEIWKNSQKAGIYTQSTTDSELDDVGYIHATGPDQTIDMLNRRFTDHHKVVLLLVDLTKVKTKVKFEASSSGTTPGLFPHIYGPLNLDAIYKTIQLARNSSGTFTAPAELIEELL